MKKALIFIIIPLWVAASCVLVYAEEWSFFEAAEKSGNAYSFSSDPLSNGLSITAEKPLEVFSSAPLTSFVPIKLDQFVVSLVDVSTNDDFFPTGETSFFSQFRLNTGIKTESYVSDFQSSFMKELQNDNAPSLDATSSILFVGVGLDFKSGYLQGNAFVGRPLDTITNRLYSKQQSEKIENQGLDTQALGFEASAGYQLTDRISLGAGFGRMNDNNVETDEKEKVYAVYAQAILALTPYIQVKPEFGQIERIKEDPDVETKDESFYAGAIWEINF